MSAGRVDILIEQGADLIIENAYSNDDGSPIDVSSYTAKMQIRTDYSSEAPVVSLVNGAGITLSTTGDIVATVTAAQTAALAVDYTQLKRVMDGQRCFKFGVYDLEIKSGAGIVTRLIAGDAYIAPAATQGI